MKLRQLNKDITFVLSCFILFIMCAFGAGLIGTLAHELMHQHYSMKPILLQVNYDGSGFMESVAFWPHNHGYVYFVQYIVFSCIMLIMLTAFHIIINYSSQKP